MDARAFVERKKGPHLLVDLCSYVFDDMEPIVANHDFLFAADRFVPLDSSFVELDDLPQLVLLALFGPHDYGSLEEVCDMEVRESWSGLAKTTLSETRQARAPTKALKNAWVTVLEQIAADISHGLTTVKCLQDTVGVRINRS